QMGRPGFRRVLLAVAESFKNKRSDLERAAESLSDAVAQAETFTGAHGTFDAGVVDSQVSSLTQLFDIRNGGFGRAPKFPHCSSLDLILECYQQAAASGADNAQHLLAMAETTLVKMSRGGMYDQLAGGFHRYSVDEKWLVPHFEKMSYDNSELLKNYLHGWQVTQNPLLRQTAEGIITWVNEVLSDQHLGGFYASQDADYSLDDERLYASWNAMFASAYLEAGRALQDALGLSCRAFALKTMNRMLSAAWSESTGFAHRIGGPGLSGSLDDQVFGVLALLDAYQT